MSGWVSIMANSLVNLRPLHCIIPKTTTMAGHADFFANFIVHSRAVASAPSSFVFQCSATSLASGSSGFGLSNTLLYGQEKQTRIAIRVYLWRRHWIERHTDLICSAGLHLSLRMSKQIRPSRSILGLYTYTRFQIGNCHCTAISRLHSLIHFGQEPDFRGRHWVWAMCQGRR